MCIDYAFRPRLSSRLTLGGRTFLATHSGILTRIQSTRALARTSPRIRRSPTPALDVQAQASVTCLAPLNFPRKITRPVSYYALFKRVAASKPTSWLFMRSHIVFHLACIWDLSCGSGLFPF